MPPGSRRLLAAPDALDVSSPIAGDNVDATGRWVDELDATLHRLATSR